MTDTIGSLAAQDAYDVPLDQGTNVGWANRLGEILTARPQYDETVQYKTASPLVQITEGDIGRATEAAMGVSGGGMKVEPVKGIKAFHSSPHDFDKFDLAKIGTGEGAQTYGHGLYFAESPAVSGQGGQYYKAFEDRFLRENKDRIEGRAFDYLKNIGGYNRAEAIPFIDETIAERLKRGLDVKDPKTHQDILAARELLASGGKVGPRTYEVNINADPAHMLDWDKPLREQAPHVRDVLRAKNGPFLDQGNAGSNWGAPGSQYYKFRSSPGMRNPAQLSEQLSKEYGIPGIKYLDQGSRGAANIPQLEAAISGLQQKLQMMTPSQRSMMADTHNANLARWQAELAHAKANPPTSNYVVFDPNIVDIMKKYGIVGAAPVGMGALAAQDKYQPDERM